MSKRKYSVTRYHDISTGHRVVGHEGKCRHLHGHNYRIHFTCEQDTMGNLAALGDPEGLCFTNAEASLDKVGRVIDFGVVKERLCMWLEENWDHKFLAWKNDGLMSALMTNVMDEIAVESIVWVPFNPTAENMAAHLVNVVGPQQLAGTGVVLVSVVIDETRKCSASYSLE